MMIELGNAEQTAAMIKFGIKVVGELERDGTLRGIIDSALNVKRKFREDSAELDMWQFNFYKESGLSDKEAFELLLADKAAKADVIKSLVHRIYNESVNVS